jgi:tRNA-2-methylthio-N6-dimethylallyladenosine synthase
VSTKPIIPLVPETPAPVAVSPQRLPPNGKRFFIWTIGCQMNEADSAKVAAMLQEVGYERTEQEDDADIVVLNSCVVRQAAEDKVAGKLNSLARLKRLKPEMPLVLTGCMVTRQQEKLKQQFPHVDLFFDPSDFDKLVDVVPELNDLEDDLADHLRLQLRLLLLHRAVSPWQGDEPPVQRHRARGRAPGRERRARGYAPWADGQCLWS